MDLITDNNNQGPNSKEVRNLWLTAILSEYNMLREEMRMFLGFHKRDTQIIVALLGVVFAVLGTETIGIEHELFYIISPSIIFIYIIAETINIHMISVEAKACARIEKRINNLFNNTLLDWESSVAKKYVRHVHSPSTLAVAGLLSFFALLFVGFSYMAHQTYGYIATIFHILEFACIAVVLIKWTIFEIATSLEL